MKSNKLYNILFPVWFLLVFPITWLVILPVNLLIDVAVIIAGLREFNIKDKYEKIKSIILQVWILGFIADIIGCLLLFLTGLFSKEDSLYYSITNHTLWNPYNSIWTILITILAILISMILIYALNYKCSFKKTDIKPKTVKRLSIFIAFFTAPWILLFPVHLVYNGSSTNINTNQVNESEQTELQNALNSLDGLAYINGGVFDYYGSQVSVNCAINTNDAAKVTEYKKIFESDQTDKLLNENATKIFKEVAYINNIVFKVSDNKTYSYTRNNMK